MATPVRAFGLDLAPNFRIAGLDDAAPAPSSSPVVLDLVTRKELHAGWPVSAERLVDKRQPNGRMLHRIEAHPEAGFRLSAAGWGMFTIDPAGQNVRCAPHRAAAWKWQRYLIGQVLPFVATVRGFEVFHASAVARADRVSVFLGHSEAGKSSIAAALMLRGWRLVADDVVTLESDGGAGPLLHPGPGLASIRFPTVERLGADAVASLGREIGRDDEAIRLAVDVDPAPRRMFALYELDRRTPTDELAIEPMEPVDPRTLLSATFNLALRTPARMIRQLDLCAELAGQVPAFRIHIPERCGPAELAAALDD